MKLYQNAMSILTVVIILASALFYGAAHEFQNNVNYYLTAKAKNDYVGSHDGLNNGVKQYSVIDHLRHISDSLKRSADSVAGIEGSWK